MWFFFFKKIPPSHFFHYLLSWERTVLSVQDRTHKISPRQEMKTPNPNFSSKAGNNWLKTDVLIRALFVATCAKTKRVTSRNLWPLWVNLFPVYVLKTFFFSISRVGNWGSWSSMSFEGKTFVFKYGNIICLLILGNYHAIGNKHLRFLYFYLYEFCQGPIITGQSLFNWEVVNMKWTAVNLNLVI